MFSITQITTKLEDKGLNFMDEKLFDISDGDAIYNSLSSDELVYLSEAIEEQDEVDRTNRILEKERTQNGK